MKNKDLDLKALENADEASLSRLADICDPLTDAEKDKIFALSQHSYRAEKMDETDVNEVSGVDIYKRPKWHRFTAIASGIILAAGIGSGSALLAKRTSTHVYDNDIISEETTTNTTTTISNGNMTITEISSQDKIIVTTVVTVRSTPLAITSASETAVNIPITTTDNNHHISVTKPVVSETSKTSKETVIPPLTSSASKTTSSKSASTKTTTKTTTTTTAANPVQPTKMLSFDDIVRISKKGEAITYDDFKEFIPSQTDNSGYVMFKLQQNSKYVPLYLHLIPGYGRMFIDVALTDSPEIDFSDPEFPSGHHIIDIRSNEFQNLAESNSSDAWWLVQRTQPVIPDGSIITMEDILRLSQKGYDLTPADFKPFKYCEDVGSGLYIPKYQIDGRDDLYLLVGHEGYEDKPVVYAIITDIYNEHSVDIRSDEFKYGASRNSEIPWWGAPENNEENRADAKAIGEYALNELKNGRFNTDTQITSLNYASMFSSEIANIMRKGVFYNVSFMGEHIAVLRMDSPPYESYGYFVSDGYYQFFTDAIFKLKTPEIVEVVWADDNIGYFRTN